MVENDGNDGEALQLQLLKGRMQAGDSASYLFALFHTQETKAWRIIHNLKTQLIVMMEYIDIK